MQERERQRERRREHREVGEKNDGFGKKNLVFLF
jgi:hypothetical protein